MKVRPIGQAINALRSDPTDQLADLYDPDTVTREFYKPAEEVARYAFVPLRAGRQDLDPPTPHRLQLTEAYSERGRLKHRLREVWIRTAAELRDLSQTREFKAARFFESTGGWRPHGVDDGDYGRFVMPFREAAIDACRAAAKMREDDSFSSGDYSIDGSGSGWGNEFVPVMGGPYYRQLYLYAHWEQTSKAFEMKNHSELAKCAIDINTDFTLGRGVAWKIRQPRVRRIWEEFWRRNKMSERLRVMSDDLTWQGELLIRKFSPLFGFVSIRSLDPGAIYEIVANPQDVEEVYFYQYQTPSPWQMPFNNLRGQRVNVQGSQYVIQQFPANEILHVKNNVSATEKWGRSDFYAALGTLKRHRDWTNATTLKDVLQANFVWTITITGDDADVQAFLANSANAKLPAFGGTWVQNQALKLESIHEDTAGASRGGQGTTGSFLTSLFATSQGHPLAYYNIAGAGAARATALVQSEPVVKKILSRQQMFRQILDHLFVVVCEQAIQAGRLSREDVRSDAADPEWIFPGLYEEDRKSKIAALQAARADEVISHRTESVQTAQELGLDEYDYDNEQAEIVAEKNRPNPPPTPQPTGNAADAAPGSQPPPGSGAASAAISGIGQLFGSGEPGQQTVHEDIKGADERHAFRQQQRQSDSGVLDQRFIEAAIKRGVTGQVRLPSGAVAVINEA